MATQALNRVKWTLNWVALLTASISFLGLAVLMYPATAAWWSQYNQSQIVSDYSAAVAEDAPPGNVWRLQRAHQYNEQLAAGELILEPGANKPILSNADAANLLSYEETLNFDSGLMARLKIPKIDVDLPVYHGTDAETLRKGVGHLKGTSLPVGGRDTHSVLTAHRGLASATLFDNLNRLEPGDNFTIEVAGEVLTYRVFETHVVDPDDTKTIEPRAGKDLVTLVTCTPLGINTHRILVTGERILPTPSEDIDAAGEDPDIPGFPWWALILGTGLVGAGIFVWRTGLPARN